MEEDLEGSDLSLNDDFSDVELLEEEGFIDKEEKEFQEVCSFCFVELDQGEGSNVIKIFVIVEEFEIVRDDYNSVDMSECLFFSFELVFSLFVFQVLWFGVFICVGICYDIEQMYIKLFYWYL